MSGEEAGDRFFLTLWQAELGERLACGSWGGGQESLLRNYVLLRLISMQ